MMFIKMIALAVLTASPLLTNAQETMWDRDSINKIRAAVTTEVIRPALQDQSSPPDWNKIEKSAKSQYGVIGEEKVYGIQMTYYLDRQDWVNFGKSYALYFKTAYDRSEYHINNLSWPIFEHITDPEILAVAVNTMRYSLEHFDRTNYQAYDTYANLLYKTGKKKEAIVWQEKAVKALPNEKMLAETLKKMKKGEPTWN